MIISLLFPLLDLWGTAWMFPSAAHNLLGIGPTLLGLLVTMFCVHIAARCLILARRRRAMILSAVRHGFACTTSATHNLLLMNEKESERDVASVVDTVSDIKDAKQWPSGWRYGCEGNQDFTEPLTTCELLYFFQGSAWARVYAGLLTVYKIAILVANINHATNSLIAASGAMRWNFGQDIESYFPSSSSENSAPHVFDDTARRTWIAFWFVVVSLSIHVFGSLKSTQQVYQWLRYGVYAVLLVIMLFSIATIGVPGSKNLASDPVRDTEFDLISMKVFLVDNFGLSFDFHFALDANLFTPSGGLAAVAATSAVTMAAPKFHAWQRGRLDVFLFLAFVCHMAFITFTAWCLPWHIAGVAPTHFAARWVEVNHEHPGSVFVALSGLLVGYFILFRFSGGVFSTATCLDVAFGVVPVREIRHASDLPSSLWHRRFITSIILFAFAISQVGDVPILGVSLGWIKWGKVLFVPGLLILYVAPVILHHSSRVAVETLRIPSVADRVPHLDLGPRRATIVLIVGFVSTVLAALYL